MPAATCEAAREGAARISASQDEARRFFEAHFTPYRLARSAFLTGYFEPELPASRHKAGPYRYPLLAPPAGLTAVTAANRPKGWSAELSHGRLTPDGLVPLPDRGAIMAGALDAENLELVWLRDPVDAFFVHVQGSTRLRLDDGSVLRVGYAGKTGHPYSSIARVLVRRGEGTPEELTMSGLRAWLEKNPGQRDALFRENRSFIFFRTVEIDEARDGPIGAAGLPLKAGRSLAIDPAHIPYGFPVFVTSQDLDELDGSARTFARLLVADDTGSAIRGAGRGDLFVGSGMDAGRIAGEIRHAGNMVLLVPNAAAAGLGGLGSAGR
ncbi:transglycosylase [Roseibium aquae]|uniref:peptidoglycan lytic exotransglycosylase n=1 Tax=Roseibium aquae TaxID=1323746 RepID=A0A916WXR6_9HYPH|nr:transglycosylase [Roseibium aquae]